MHEILQWICKNWAITLFGASCLIQISPIKINPWTVIWKYLSEKLTGDLKKEVSSLKDEQSKQHQMIIENEKDRIRWEVLDFANSCRNKRKHTKAEFEHIIVLNGKYTELLKETNDTNGVFEADYDYILDLYKWNQKNDGFLK